MPWPNAVLLDAIPIVINSAKPKRESCDMECFLGLGLSKATVPSDACCGLPPRAGSRFAGPALRALCVDRVLDVGWVGKFGSATVRSRPSPIDRGRNIGERAIHVKGGFRLRKSPR